MIVGRLEGYSFEFLVGEGRILFEIAFSVFGVVRVGAFCSVAVDVKVAVLADTLVAIELVDAVGVVVAVVSSEKALVVLLLAVSIRVDVVSALEHTLTIIALLARFAVELVVGVAFIIRFAIVPAVASFALALVTLALCLAVVVVAARIAFARILVAFWLTLAVSVLDVAFVADTLVLGAAIVLAGRVSRALDFGAFIVVAALAVVVVEAILAGALVAFAQVSTVGVVGTGRSSTLVFVARSVATFVTVFLAVGADSLTFVAVVVPAIVAVWGWCLSWDVACWSDRWNIRFIAEHAAQATEHAVPVGADAICRAVGALGVDDGLDALEQWLLAVAPLGVVALDLDGSGAAALASVSVVVALELVHTVSKLRVKRHGLLGVGSAVLDSVKRGV